MTMTTIDQIKMLERKRKKSMVKKLAEPKMIGTNGKEIELKLGSFPNRSLTFIVVLGFRCDLKKIVGQLNTA